MKSQYGFKIDAELCIGCFTCAMACKNQNQLEPGVKWRQVHPLDEAIYPHTDRAFYSLSCNHCETPCCVESCPVGAYSKREKDGVVIHNQAKCIGCKNCIRSCPFGAPVYNASLKKAEKCSFCFQRLDANRTPACAQGCPTGALKVVDLATEDVSDLVQYPQGFPQAKRLNPSVRFRNPQQPQIIRRES
ncbi:Fe-S-cluster-containing dehydrogenase component [Desulfuromusa kysingii]|uniref:Fe-S-cluster-containing dehydrogenase component n=1 Tax=Desulfuromusa kysingii TaxID=37625 RepID=A0A1H4DQC2_9BACT|nr:4Fe-4S dicluster domain-containing protein [Desulfuromusa kysingii]SEA74955.1 Fe-S-cluster-containing dehydrogenase component [Desulfuromusa kysingii]